MKISFVFHFSFAEKKSEKKRKRPQGSPGGKLSLRSLKFQSPPSAAITKFFNARSAQFSDAWLAMRFKINKKTFSSVS
jgi:hypothetical protein